MARYKLTGPNGKQYLLSGPSGASKEDLVNILGTKLGTSLEEPLVTTPKEAPDATFGESIKDIGYR
jgi:hypothetical protein